MVSIFASPAAKPYPNPKTVVIIGSSTGAGSGASSYAGENTPPYASPSTSWGGLLTTALKAIDPSWKVINRSVSGTSTATSIARFYTDVAIHRPSHVILCTSSTNEPLWSTDQIGSAKVYVNNCRYLAQLCQSIGAQPIQVSAYAKDAYTASGYAAALDINAQLEQSGVPIIDWLSTLDDGSGHFLPGFSSDGTHVADVGHAFYFDAIDLNLFTSVGGAIGVIEAGSGAWKIANTSGGIKVVLASSAKSCAIRARIKSAAGAATGSAPLNMYLNGDAGIPLRIRCNGPLKLSDAAATDLAVSTIDPASDFNVHDVLLSYNAATGKAFLVVDGAQVGAAATVNGSPGAATSFSFGWRPDTGASNSTGFSFSEICVWRTPLSVQKAIDLQLSGRVPSASLAYHGKLTHAPRLLASNVAPGGVLAAVSSGAWSQVAAF